MAKKKRPAQGAARQRAGRPPNKQEPPAGRLAAHRPSLERILFILALAGVLVTWHLNIWYGKEAALLTDDPVCGAGFDCQAVLASDPMPLGVPSAVWGLLFYLAVAGVCAGIAFLSGEKGLLLKKARVGLISVGLAYSLFLTGYQFFALSDRCLLCLLSASVVALMAVTQYVYLFKPARPTRSRRSAPGLKLEYQIYGGLAVLLLLLGGADFVYFNSLSLPDGGGMTETMQVAADLPVDVSQCRFDPDKPYYSNFDRLVAEDDPIQGNREAPVTLVEFIDPNCPHCKTVHPVIKAIAAKYPDNLRIVYKPVALVGSATYSLEEVAALFLANEAGKFPEMLDLEFINQQNGGLSVTELTRFARQLGMDAAQFGKDLADGRFNGRVRGQKQLFDGLGLSGVPTVILEGRVIHTSSRSVGCLSHFIEQELQAQGLLEEAEATVDEAAAEETPATEG